MDQANILVELLEKLKRHPLMVEKSPGNAPIYDLSRSDNEQPMTVKEVTERRKNYFKRDDRTGLDVSQLLDPLIKMMKKKGLLE